MLVFKNQYLSVARPPTIYSLTADLVDLFGKPGDADGCKVSGIFTYANDYGDIFTIYDWKMTTLYHGENSDCLTPDEFWQDGKQATVNFWESTKDQSDELWDDTKPFYREKMRTGFQLSNSLTVPTYPTTIPSYINPYFKLQGNKNP